MFLNRQEFISVLANQAFVFFWIKLNAIFFEIPNLAKTAILVLEKIELLFVTFQAFIFRGKDFTARI